MVALGKDAFMSGLIGILIFVAVIGGGLLVMAATRSQHISELHRLEKHQKKLAEKEALGPDESIFFQTREDYLGKLLSWAGLESKYDQMKNKWGMTALVSGVVFACLGLFLGGGSGELAIAAFIFGVPIGAMGFIMYIKQLAKARQTRLTEQLPNVLETMVGSLKAGSPIMEVFKTLSETAPEPIRGEFKRALVSLQLGKSFRDVLEEMSTRIRTPDFRLLTQAIFISQDVGGNLADVVATIADAIRERFKLRDFLNSLTAQGKFSAWFIGSIPYGITLMMALGARDYMMPFLNNIMARCVFGAFITWELIGVYILMRLTTFEI